MTFVPVYGTSGLTLEYSRFGDANLDKLWTALRAAGPQGLARDEIHTLFSKNGSAAAYDQMAAALVTRGFAREETRRTGQRGRPPVVLVAAD